MVRRFVLEQGTVYSVVPSRDDPEQAMWKMQNAINFVEHWESEPMPICGFDVVARGQLTYRLQDTL